MRKYLFLIFTLYCVQLSAQNCSQNESVTRFMARGKAALKIAESPEDYKLAANEYLRALEYDAKCPDIYYQLALCYEQMGKLDPGNYQEAISHLQTYLAFRPDAENKQEIQEKVYELEFLLDKAGGISLNELVGQWKFYWGDGTTPDKNNEGIYDIEIFANNGNFYAKCIGRRFTMKRMNIEYVENSDDESNCEITYEEGVINFKYTSTIEINSTLNGQYVGLSRTIRDLIYDLKIENEEKIQGERICTRYWTGEILDKKFKGGGEWKIYNDCNGDCGGNKVYFIKQR